jgi:hemerythrin-like metal-binding protein
MKNSLYGGKRMNECEITRAELKKALLNKEFVYYYQPKISMITGEVCGAEALIRWIKADGTIVPPGKFIPLAESTGFISELTLAMYDNFIVELSIIHDIAPDMPISFNASAKDFEDFGLTEKIRKSINNHNIKIGTIEVELTETVMMDDNESVRRNLLLLNELGVHLVMDDFGTGFSTIDTLSKWPFSTLKIDQGVVNRMLSSDKDLTIIQSSIRMAHQLGLDIVAEGIETEEVYILLQNAGCNTAQGYHCSRPIPLIDFLHFITDGTRWPALPVGLIHMAQLDLIQWRKEVIDGACALCAVKGNPRPIRGNPNMDPHKSMFGKWYYSAGRQFEGLEPYDRMEEPHKQLHELGTDLIETARRSTHKEEIMPMIRKLTSLSIEVLNLLQQLENEITMAPDGLYDIVHRGTLFNKILQGKINKIEWSGKLSVGVKSIDEQHKQILDMINLMVEYANTDLISESTTQTLAALERHCITHFGHEEAILIKYNYPDIKSHIEMHDEFKTKISLFPFVPKEDIALIVVEHLSDWLVNHILKEDMQYKVFFEERGLLDKIDLQYT